MMGCHQPSERFKGTIIPFAWFAKGLRILDIADPFAPARGRLLRAGPAGRLRALPHRTTSPSTIAGLLYLIDRQRGVDIIETSVL